MKNNRTIRVYLPVGIVALCSVLFWLFGPFSNSLEPEDFKENPGVGTVIKSPNDKRNYRNIRLENQLQVLLVSDPELKNSALSLAVPVGSMANPDQQLGLAHYLEHMLFLGSKRYPIINDYSKFMSQNGGHTNAYTSQKATVYAFEINDKKFPEAIDRMADVMSSPLLDIEYAEKEKQIVNAEHQTYFDNDMRKFFALQRYTLNPLHPMSRFSTGTLETLKDKDGSDLHQELVDFFDKYYSANLMKVAIISPRPIDELEALSSSLLMQIPNKKSKIEPITPPLITKNQQGIVVEIHATADIKLLQANFLVPSLTEDYRFKAGGYISRLLGSDHRGGLSDSLQKRGLVESVMAGFYRDYSDQFSQFSIQFQLTNKGVKSTDQILESLFSFIRLIEEQGINDLQFNEQKIGLESQFKFLAKSSSFSYVMGLSANMLTYSGKDILYFPYRLDSFNSELVSGIFSHLTPS
ncbi:MAG: insulinase family protein, partial [Thiotrichaceae bacterium]|nr:insulinase family protein [Thiotrichaceae bacterium]